jgi:hypothetical protein
MLMMSIIKSVIVFIESGRVSKSEVRLFCRNWEKGLWVDPSLPSFPIHFSLPAAP